MKKFIISAVLVFLYSSLSFGQFGSSGPVDARSMSMGKTYNASSNGVYSLGINPANLMFSENKYFEFSTVLPMPGLAASSGSNFISLKDFNYFFGGVDGEARLLTTEDKDRLSELFKDGGEVFGNVSLNLFSAMYKANPTVGAFALSVSDFAGGKMIMPKALVDLGLNGNQLNTTYDFNDAEMEATWLRYYTLTYARELPEFKQSLFQTLSVGVSLKLVSGFTYGKLSQVNTSFSTGENNRIDGKSDMILYSAMSEDFGNEYDFDSTSKGAESHMGPFPKPAGSGFGIDLGFAAAMDNKWRFSLAVTDIGKMTWDKKPVMYTASGDITVSDLSDSKQLDTLEERLKAKGSYTQSLSSDLPTTLRAGASYLFNDENDGVPGSLLLALDINQGFNNVPGNSTKTRVSLGSEWLLTGWFNLRTGLSFGGHDGFNWALGFGLDAGLVEFNFATTDMQSFVAPNSAKRLSVSLGSRWKI